MSDILDSNESGKLEINAEGKYFLKTACSWANFLAIVGFIMLCLMLVLGMYSASIMSQLGGASVVPMITIVIAVVIYFFPTYYLFTFARKTKRALNSSDSNMLSSGFDNLQAMFKYMGILMIIVLSIYAILFVYAGAGIMSNFR